MSDDDEGSNPFTVDKDPSSYGQSKMLFLPQISHVCTSPLTPCCQPTDADVTWSGLAGSYAMAFLFQFAAFVMFSCLRRTKYGMDWLEPKRNVNPDQTPPRLRTDTLFGWLPQLAFMDEAKILM